MLNLRRALIYIVIELFILLYSPGIKAYSSEECLGTLGRGVANSIEWSRTSDVLAVGASTGIWFFNSDLEPLGEIYTTESVLRLAWSPVELRLASLSYSGILTIWSQFSAQQYVELFNIEETVMNFSWSPDGTKLAVLYQEPRVDILDAQTGDLLVSIDDTNASSLLLIDNERLIIGSAHEGQVWDIHTGNYQFSLVDEETVALINWDILSILPDNRLIIASRQPDTIQTWDLGTRHLVTSFSYIGDEFTLIRDLQTNQQRDHIAIQIGTIIETSDSGVDIVDIDNWQTVTRIGHPSGISAMSWTGEGNILTVLTNSGGIQNWRIGDNQPTLARQLFTTPITALSWSVDDNILVSAGYGNGYPIQLWDGDSTQVFQYDPITSFEAGQVTNIALNNLSQNQITIYSNEFVPVRNTYVSHMRVFNTVSGQVEQVIFETADYTTPTLVLYPDNHFITYQDGEVFRVDVMSKDVVARINVGTESSVPVTAIDWNEQSNRLINLRTDLSSNVTFIEIWDTLTSQLVTNDEVPYLARQLKISPNGDYFALSGRNINTDTYMGQIWDINPLQLILDFTTDQQSLMTWSTNSAFLAYTLNRQLNFIDIDSNNLIWNNARFGDITSMTWLSSVDRLAFGTLGGIVCIIDLSSELP